MRRLLLGVAGLAVVSGGVYLLLREDLKGRQDGFFLAAESGDVDRLLSKLAPELVGEIDPPALKAWMQGLTRSLGEYEGLSKQGNSWRVSKKQVEGREVAAVDSRVRFRKGEVEAHLVFMDGRVAGFSVDPKAFAPRWFDRMDTTGYRRRGEELLRAILAEDVDRAWSMMSPAYRAHESLETLRAIAARVAIEADVENGPRSGPIGDGPIPARVSYESEEFIVPHLAPFVLKIVYRTEQGTSVHRASVSFQFPTGLKAHLVAFTLREGE